MDTMLNAKFDMLIALLARSTLGIEYIDNIVRSKKKKGKPDDFVKAYNSMDGNQTVTALAKVVGISQQGMSSVIKTWEKAGIIYNIGTKNQPVYKALLKLPL